VAWVGRVVGSPDLLTHQRRIPGMFRRMVAPSVKLASFADLEALPADVRAKIIRGVIVEQASSSAENGGLQAGSA
jgi:hypothetical protein